MQSKRDGPGLKQLDVSAAESRLLLGGLDDFVEDLPQPNGSRHETGEVTESPTSHQQKWKCNTPLKRSKLRASMIDD